MKALILGAIVVAVLYALSSRMMTLDGFQNVVPPEQSGDVHPNETAVWVIIGIALAGTVLSVVYLIQHNRRGGH
jgi:hypothetical protein